MGGALAPPIEHLIYISTYLRVAVCGGFAVLAGAGGPWGQGLKSLNFVNFQGPEHVKHEGFGLPGLENSMRINEKTYKMRCFCSPNDGFARFGYVFYL